MKATSPISCISGPSLRRTDARQLSDVFPRFLSSPELMYDERVVRTVIEFLFSRKYKVVTQHFSVDGSVTLLVSGLSLNLLDEEESAQWRRIRAGNTRYGITLN